MNSLLLFISFHPILLINSTTVCVVWCAMNSTPELEQWARNRAGHPHGYPDPSEPFSAETKKFVLEKGPLQKMFLNWSLCCVLLAESTLPFATAALTSAVMLQALRMGTVRFFSLTVASMTHGLQFAKELRKRRSPSATLLALAISVVAWFFRYLFQAPR